MIKQDRFVFKEFTDINILSKKDSSLLANLDDLKSVTWENSMETSNATGAGGVVIASYDKNKASTISGSNATITDGLLALQTGGEVTNSVQLIPNHMDYIQLDSETEAKTEFVAVGAEGAEIKYLYKYESNSFNSEKYTQDAEADASHFAYDPVTKVITLPVDVFKAGDVVVAQYDFKCEAKHLSNETDKFPTAVRVEANALFTNLCTGEDYLGKVVYPNAKADGNFSIETGDEPAVHNFSFSAMQDRCSGTKAILWDYFIYDTADAK